MYSHGVYAVFPIDPDLMPQEFETYDEALAFAEEWFGPGECTIEYSP